jgi:hypothetical protein
VTVVALRKWHDEFGDHSDKGLVIDTIESKKHALIARCSSPHDQVQWTQVKWHVTTLSHIVFATHDTQGMLSCHSHVSLACY